jgi:dTDP-4-dehydrorhamnose reductase
LKVLVLGAGGMLGHKMVQTLSARFPETWCTLWGSKAAERWRRIPALQTDRCLDGVDVTEWPRLEALLGDLRPDAIVNCVGVIKQRPEAERPIPSIAINALLPHRLAEAAARWNGRLVHFSTDCVFSGRRGGYTEADASDAEDLYGRSKSLGEVASAANALTLRTSIIGRELENHQSLLDWFLLCGLDKVQGFRRVWWSGVTTNHLADLVGDILDSHPTLAGLFQVSSGRISKYELLCRVRDGYGLAVEVVPDDGPVNDRSLLGAKLEGAIGYRCPPWEQLIAQVVSDPTPYEPFGERRGG